jgi:hypothetical protein
MKEGVFLNFRITGENLDFDEISEITGLVPSKVYRKGDEFSTKYFNHVSSTDCWLTDYEIPEERSLKEALTEFLLPFMKNKEYISNLAKKQCIEVWISIYPINRQMNIQISRQEIAMLAELNVELGIVITDLSEFMSDQQDG